jgi:hypothetical protein
LIEFVLTLLVKWHQKGCDSGAYIENVLIICESDHELHDQFTTTSSNSTTSSPVGVLPIDSIILFVETDDVFRRLAVAFGIRYDTIEILKLIRAAQKLSFRIIIPL